MFRLLSKPLIFNSLRHRSIQLSKAMSSSQPTLPKSEKEWRAILSPEQFAILRQKDTERPGTGEYLNHKESGLYRCVGCGNPLYESSTKFDSHCGWPSFFQAIPGALKYNTDTTLGRVRTEMVCSKCDGHLGHVFLNEGYDNPTNERHCVNSISLKFDPTDSKPKV